jgi:uncharacterized protein YceK
MGLLKSLLFLLVVCSFSGCASIVSKTKWPFSVESEPSGAHISITNKKGYEVYKGKTPAAMQLKSGAGFFSKESYVVEISMDGYDTKKINVECKLNAWYFGNVVFGGVVGLLIIDPATGAMFKLASEGLTETLTKSTATTLKILDRNNLPAHWEKHLVRIN